MSDSPYGFENLQHSKLLPANSKDDKAVSFDISVFNGTASINVFTGAGGRPWRLPFPMKDRMSVARLLKRIRAEPKGGMREPVFLNEWVDDNGKNKIKQVGCMGFGIDENLMFYIDLTHDTLNGRHMFPIKLGTRLDFSNTTMTEKDLLISVIDYVIDVIETVVPQREALSSFKRPAGGASAGGGGQKSGGWNQNRGSGGGNGGGYNQQNRQNATFSGGPDSDNDLNI